MEPSSATARGELYSRRLARYLFHCCVNDFGFHHTDLTGAIERYTKGDKKTGALKAKEQKEPFTLSTALPFITWQHELSHYRALVSTGTGALIWRLNTEILSTAGFMVRRINMSSAGTSIRAPFQEWYETEGRAKIAADPPYDPAVAQSFGLSEAEFRRRSPLQMEMKSRELDKLLRFRDAFMGTLIMPMRDFVALANQVVSILADRSEIPEHREFHWNCRDESLLSQLPDPTFTVTELLEVEARLHEEILLQQLGASRADISEWRNKHVFGVYKRAYDWLLTELGDSKLARIALDQALMGPVDPSSMKASSGEAIVEDAHPSWRLIKVVKAMQESFWPWETENRAMLMSHGISEAAQVPTPLAVADSLLEIPLHSDTALRADAILGGIKPESTSSPYIEYSEAAMRFAVEHRKKSPLAIIAPSGPFGLKPLIEFYRDCVVINTLAIRDGKPHQLINSPDLIPQATTAMIGGLALFALLSDGDVADLPRLESSYRAEVRFAGSPEGVKGAPFDVRGIVATVLGKSAAERLYWGESDD